MSRRTLPTRTSILLAILFVLLGFTAWTHRDLAVLAPTTEQPTTRVAEPVNRRHLYFGPPQSVAVLPFSCARYVSPEHAADAPQQQPAAGESGSPMVLAFGLAREVTDRLTSLPDLQVTSTDSTFFFADSTAENLLLAERLRSRHLLDGCVSRQGDELTLKLRLYDTRNGKYEWTDNWSGSPDRLQPHLESVVVSVVELLEPGLVLERPTGESIAPGIWLRRMEGRDLLRRGDPESLEQAREIFREILQQEGPIASVWLDLAQVYLRLAGRDAGDPPAHEQAREAAEAALDNDAGLAGAYLLLSRLERFFDRDFDAARRHAERALELAGGDAAILANASSNRFISGQFEQAIDLLEQSIERNPVVLNMQLKLGLIHEFNRNFEQSLLVYRQLLVLNDTYPGVYAFRTRVRLAQGNADAALTEAEQEIHPFWQRYARILALDALQRTDESDPLLQQMEVEDGRFAATQIAEIYALRGEPDQAFGWLEQALEQNDGGLSEVAVNPFFGALHKDARWNDLLVRIGLGGRTLDLLQSAD